jgi:hypothetical protein
MKNVFLIIYALRDCVNVHAGTAFIFNFKNIHNNYQHALYDEEFFRACVDQIERTEGSFIKHKPEEAVDIGLFAG